MTRHTVSILPHNIKTSCPEGTTALDILVDAGLHVKTPCGGRGTCGKCLIRIEGPCSIPDNGEMAFIKGTSGTRLACRAVIEGDVVLHLPEPPRDLEKKALRVIPGREFGLAIDLGTTSIQVSLVELPAGPAHRVDSFLNPQRRYGHDVITRIAAAGEKKARESLVGLLRKSLAQTLLDTSARSGIALSSIRRVVFSGNTAMTYFLLDQDTAPLGVYPYTADLRDFSPLPAGRIFPGTGLAAEAHALPAASAYIGGDLLGGLAILDQAGFTENTFFFDIGTNGEMFIRKNEQDIFAASCAMGPALEGMNISSGMTADPGAVTHVREENGAIVPEVMGEEEPAGISGTGLIDIIAVMLRSGILEYSGAFNKNALAAPPLKNLSSIEEGTGVRLSPLVGITQKDIRNIQLAKGASLASARLLLDQASCDAGSVTDVMIAGAFGENLDLDNFRRLGFLPDFPNARYHFMGNTSLRAAETACRDIIFLDRAISLRERVKVIELSAHPLFNDTFMDSLEFH